MRDRGTKGKEAHWPRGGAGQGRVVRLEQESKWEREEDEGRPGGQGWGSEAIVLSVVPSKLSGLKAQCVLSVFVGQECLHWVGGCTI